MIQIAIKATHNLDDCEDFCLRLLDKLDAEDVRLRVIVYYNKMDFKLNSLGKREIL